MPRKFRIVDEYGTICPDFRASFDIYDNPVVKQIQIYLGKDKNKEPIYENDCVRMEVIIRNPDSENLFESFSFFGKAKLTNAGSIMIKPIVLNNLTKQLEYYRYSTKKLTLRRSEKIGSQYFRNLQAKIINL